MVDEQSFGEQQGGALAPVALLVGNLVDPPGERDAAGVGGEFGQLEQSGGLRGEMPQVKLDLPREPGFVSPSDTVSKKSQAGLGRQWIKREKSDGDGLMVGQATGLEVELTELTTNGLGVRKPDLTGDKTNEGEFRQSPLPIQLSLQDDAGRGFVQLEPGDKILRLIEVPAVIGGHGGILREQGGALRGEVIEAQQILRKLDQLRVFTVPEKKIQDLMEVTNIIS